jgi:hypothetical protein
MEDGEANVLSEYVEGYDSDGWEEVVVNSTTEMDRQTTPAKKATRNRRQTLKRKRASEAKKKMAKIPARLLTHFWTKDNYHVGTQ